MYEDLVKRMREIHPEEFGDAWDIDLLWFDNSWWDRLNSGEYAVTHWMPLPPAPEPPKEEA